MFHEYFAGQSRVLKYGGAGKSELSDSSRTSSFKTVPWFKCTAGGQTITAQPAGMVYPASDKYYIKIL
ncbi:hypothetical protein H5410_043638 [Solanum commersonii]|uniref:Uncharacterized protein n=1 Tax=Solanum commersonii TaxID=4109 RepID=A0A9J5Y1C0_SOLCO|nr:hypothetical protein H5410_043638 [Solanum commersonii]